MLISEKFVFVELQKTASTHIRALLEEHVGGEIDGKHDMRGRELLDSGRESVASVCASPPRGAEHFRDEEAARLVGRRGKSIIETSGGENRKP
jgi:hypothetical protein